LADVHQGRKINARNFRENYFCGDIMVHEIFKADIS
jgi:hypothetical protein